MPLLCNNLTTSSIPGVSRIGCFSNDDDDDDGDDGGDTVDDGDDNLDSSLNPVC